MHIEADRTHVKAADGAVVQALPTGKKVIKPVIGNILNVS